MRLPSLLFGLRARFGFWFAVFVLLLMVAANVYFATHERRALRREIELRGVAIARSVAVNSEDPLVINDDLLLAKAVADARRHNPGVLYCFLTNEQGKIVASSELKGIDQYYRPPESLDRKSVV